MTIKDGGGNVVKVGDVLVGERGGGKRQRRCTVIGIDADYVKMKELDGRGREFSLYAEQFSKLICGWRKQLEAGR